MKKKNSFWFKQLILLFFLSFVLAGCPPIPDKLIKEPRLTTSSPGSITSTSATTGGNVTFDGYDDVTARGVCWGTSTGPTLANGKTSDGIGTGIFSSSLTGLNPGATYYVRAYATNSAGTAYGNEVSFTTLANAPTVTTNAVTAITSTTATSGGTISADGGGAITARGVCWNTATGPTISNSKTTDGTGAGSFVSSLIALTPGAKYFVRAYATNSAGTSYGNEVSFTVLANLPTVTTTTTTTAITATGASSGGNVTADGGGAVTARGVCISTSTGPTISNTKTSDGSGTGNFTSSLTSLTANTTYYVKAYATNSAGTAYGAEISFKTSAIPPIVSTTAASSVTSNTASTGGNVTSDGGASITARGVCWGASSGPSIAGSKTTDAGTTGIFTSSLTLLIAGTTYYVRAYATNSSGTAYGNEISFTTLSTNGIIFNPNLTYGSLTDIDGNVYKTIQIGKQVWMAENLKTAKFKDGTIIPFVNDNNAWANLTTSAACWYNNDVVSNKDVYGALYNWYPVNTGKLCPTGWHVPSDVEWTTLTTYLGGENGTGIMLKEIGTSHWITPNVGATNTSGFTAVPGGARSVNSGIFTNFGFNGCWWSSSEYSTYYAWARYVGYSNIYVGRSDYNKQYGLSVRCLKD